MPQTFKINGKSMTHAQAVAWREAQNEKPQEVVEKTPQLEEKKYDQKNSIEIEFDRLEGIGYINLKGDERKMYTKYKKQLGK